VQWARDVIERQVAISRAWWTNSGHLSHRARQDHPEEGARRTLRVGAPGLRAAQPLMLANGHRFDVMLGETGDDRCDLVRLVQVLQNLLDNAPNTRRNAGASNWSPACRREVEIEVRDNARESRRAFAEVFELFRQGEHGPDRSQAGSASSHPGGQLVELHGGRVEARSAGLGQGASFTVRLPAVLDAAEDASPTEDGPPPSPRGCAAGGGRRRGRGGKHAMLLRLEGHEIAARIRRGALRCVGSFSRGVLLDIGLPDKMAMRSRENPEFASGAELKLIA